MFNQENCRIPTVYCGTETVLPTSKKGSDAYYVRHGTAHECMSKGFGAGMISVQLKGLPANSLRHIKYVGEVYEQKFIDNDINTVTSLLKFSNTNNKKTLENLLKKIFVKKDGVFDKRAYNSTLLYLFRNGNKNSLPPCQKITNV
jgi:hypothetical protein